MFVWSRTEAVPAIEKRRNVLLYPQSAMIRIVKGKTASAPKEILPTVPAQNHALPVTNSLGATTRLNVWVRTENVLLVTTKGANARRWSAPRSDTHHFVIRVEAREVTANAPAYLRRIISGKNAHVWNRKALKFKSRCNPKRSSKSTGNLYRIFLQPPTRTVATIRSNVRIRVGVLRRTT
jgi:hypothetical protein